ncbi:hypothetical protein PVK06_039684 [Gossypium arboreum]|uniref:RNase H type-1 domain-containing protein n=1 Tax=Gossypium arboreum TaxID=29729 RepID=A0ABR0N459_GOSAR|nr:hypothetical protein PVK06_039684 [Gossypium arboreum]
MGRWVVGFGRNIGCCLVLSAELCAVYDNLGVAWEAGISRLVEESDCWEAIDLLKSQTNALCDGCHGQGCKRTIPGATFFSTTSCLG